MSLRITKISLKARLVVLPCERSKSRIKNEVHCGSFWVQTTRILHDRSVINMSSLTNMPLIRPRDNGGS